MRQLLIKTGLLLFVVLAAASCDKDSEKEIGYDALPQKARQFIAQYFPNAECTRIVRDKDDGTTEYETWFSDGTELDFDKQGDWTSVDCKFSALPEGILPEAIATDIATRYPESIPYKVSITGRNVRMPELMSCSWPVGKAGPMGIFSTT